MQSFDLTTAAEEAEDDKDEPFTSRDYARALDYTSSVVNLGREEGEEEYLADEMQLLETGRTEPKRRDPFQSLLASEIVFMFISTVVVVALTIWSGFIAFGMREAMEKVQGTEVILS